ncbi:MAG: hypothetical protein AAGK78_00145 [Planctomycetota bacterium]
MANLDELGVHVFARAIRVVEQGVEWVLAVDGAAAGDAAVEPAGEGVERFERAVVLDRRTRQRRQVKRLGKRDVGGRVEGDAGVRHV